MAIASRIATMKTTFANAIRPTYRAGIRAAFVGAHWQDDTRHPGPPAGTRTQTWTILSRLPLPIGLQGEAARLTCGEGWRTHWPSQSLATECAAGTSEPRAGQNSGLTVGRGSSAGQNSGSTVCGRRIVGGAGASHTPRPRSMNAADEQNF